MTALSTKPDYGIDAPKVMRNLFALGGLAVLLVFVTPAALHFGKNVIVLWHAPLAWMGGFLLVQGVLFLLYVKWGKFRHRDLMLRIAALRGSEQVLDVGCGRGLLLAGAAKQIPNGHATGMDIWSTTDMGGNSSAATEHNLVLEGVADRCSLVTANAQEMPFEDASFEVVLSNLCLHNIYDKATRTRAVEEIGRVLKPGGVALLSDFKHVGEYADILRRHGLAVETKWGNPVTTFPPLRIAVARKPTTA
jgi:arsenite methyltransferase